MKYSRHSREEITIFTDDDCLREVDLQNLTLRSCKKTDDAVATQAPSTAESRNSVNSTENLNIAYDDLEDLEVQLGDLTNPQHPPTREIRDYEIFRDRVVTATYMAKPTSYFVADICCDMSPLSPFPDPSVAATFAEYYKERYSIELHEDQPLLTVSHISKRLNLLSSRYQDIKGRDLPLPDSNSKRYGII